MRGHTPRVRENRPTPRLASPAISAYTAVIPTMTMAGLSGQARMTTPITSDTRPLTPRQRALRS